jgi:hypothetical protein
VQEVELISTNSFILLGCAEAFILRTKRRAGRKLLVFLGSPAEWSDVM